jgi:hypothetical protein
MTPGSVGFELQSNEVDAGRGRQVFGERRAAERLQVIEAEARALFGNDYQAPAQGQSGKDKGQSKSEGRQVSPNFVLSTFPVAFPYYLPCCQDGIDTKHAAGYPDQWP